MGQVPRLFQFRHLVADGRGTELTCQVAGQGLGADRFSTTDVGLHQKLKDILLPSRQLILSQHGIFYNIRCAIGQSTLNANSIEKRLRNPSISASVSFSIDGLSGRNSARPAISS